MSSNLRIVLIGPVYPYRGGIAHFTTLLARTLEQTFQSIFVISFKRQYPAWLYPGKSDKDPSQQYIKIPAEFTLDPLYLWTWKKTARQILNYRPDGVIVSWWTTFWAPAYAYLCHQLQKEGIPVIYLIHNVLPHETRLWDRWMAKLALNHGNAFIVQSVQEQTTLQDLIPHAQIKLSPHPIYTQFNAGTISRNEARKKLHLTIEDRVALFFGLIRPYKGLQNAIQAIAQLRESGIRVVLLIAGEIWGNKQEYMDQVERLGIADQVIFDDRYIPNEEVGIFFSAADVFLAPYRSSTQSGVAKIAIAFGLPLVVTGSVAHGIDGGYPALFVVPSEDSLELANAIEKALNQKTSEVFTDFSTTAPGWDQLAQAITELVENLRS